MAKRSATKNRARPAETAGAVGPRQPCPCGSGKRYKACHGAAGGAADVIVTRPFDGLAAECELVALREFVPSATAPLPLKDADREVLLATVLPMAAAAMVRSDGTALVGLQVQTRSGDVSRDLARAVRWALTAEPGNALPAVGPEAAGHPHPGTAGHPHPGTAGHPHPGTAGHPHPETAGHPHPETAGQPGTGEDTARLQDLLDPAAPLDVTLHDDFSWWLAGEEAPSGEVALSLERANGAILPTARIDADGVEAAYWTDARGKAHLRWVRPEPEERLLAAMARLAARGEAGGELDLGEGSRFAGSFRAHGLLVPVWDLDSERHAREWARPAAAFAARLADALSSLDDRPLTDAERRVLQGLRGRQLTIR